MTGRFRPDPAAGPATGPAAESYLAEVAERLAAPSRYRAEVVAELRSGLADAAQARRLAGWPAREAELAAIAEFGDAAAVAGSFRAEAVARQARRSGIGLLLTGPLVGLLWVATAEASHLRIGQALPWPLTASPSGLSVGVSLVALAAAVTVWGASVSIAATGRFGRWLRTESRNAAAAAAIAGCGAIGADGLGLLLLGLGLATIPGRLAPLPAAIAVAASAVRIFFAGRAARRCLALRASLTSW